MAISLSDIKKGKQKRPPRILLYGIQGAGKTTWAASAPGAIITQTEDRTDHVDADRFPLCESFSSACETVKKLIEADHNYRTHITDSLDWLEKLAHKELCEEHGETAITSNAKGSAFGYGRGYLLAEEKMRHYLNGLAALRDKKNMGIIIIAHAAIKRFEDPMRESYDQYRPNIHERINSMFAQWVDCVFFVNFEKLTKTEEDSKGRERKIGIGKGKRILYTEERPSFEAKNSYNLPAELEFPEKDGFQVFANIFNDFFA